MKTIIIILLLLITALVFASDIKPISCEKSQIQSHQMKLIHVLKDKKGNPLRNVYIEDFKNDVFNKLLILKVKNGKVDTLYYINKWLFFNSKGIDITSSKENFNGWKIDRLTDESIGLFGIGKGPTGVGASDPALIEWNPKKKLFAIQVDD